MIHIKTFLIVDGHSLAHRGLHAMNVKLTANDGTPTAMIVGFMNMLYWVQDELLPDCTVIVFDAKGKTFRHELQNDYKAGRPPLPDDLRIQLPILQELLRRLGFRVVMIEGVEADDTAASVARLVKGEGYEAVILSSDKDLFQILGDGIRIMRPVKKGVTGAEVYDENSFVREYGFSPLSMPDYLAITGDSADNIKGVTGIGDKGAKKLLAQYPTLEAIYASLAEIPKSTRAKLESAGRDETIRRRDNMIMLRDNLFADNPGFLDECMNARIDFDGAEELALRLGLTRVLKRIGSAKKPLPREFFPSANPITPECDIITLDYKAELRDNPARFTGGVSVWDVRTGYYLLHPDEAGRNFPTIADGVNASPNPSQALETLAGNIESEIRKYDGLHSVMRELDLPLIPVLNRMEDRGVRIDPEKFTVIQNELERRILQIEDELIQATGTRINLNSSAQVSRLLFERLGFTPESKTKGKTAYSTEAAVLERLAKEENGHVPALILEHRELSKMLTGFVIPFQKAGGDDGIIHTKFEPSVTGTGRLSSRDPNLQNIPAFGEWAGKIKSALIPVNPENVFVAADYSQIELRVLAYLSKEERLIEAFEKGRDIHTETASWVFGVMPELVMPEMRRAAKMVNFGLLYGMGSFGLAERLGVSRSEAKDIITRYFDALPNIQGFIDGLVDGAKERGYARTLAGRIRPVKEIPANGPALDRALINMPVQGTAADIARRAMIDFEGSCRAELFLQVHDSLVCECNPNDAQEVSHVMREVMIHAGGEISHLEVEVKTGKSLAGV
ncbi:MAG: DNA polymerase I [Synergistaceae bacterium]|nr:DNA polymerase I [Synergistaceae bacterium]